MKIAVLQFIVEPAFHRPFLEKNPGLLSSPRKTMAYITEKTAFFENVRLIWHRNSKTRAFLTEIGGLEHRV